MWLGEETSPATSARWCKHFCRLLKCCSNDTTAITDREESCPERYPICSRTNRSGRELARQSFGSHAETIKRVVADLKLLSMWRIDFKISHNGARFISLPSNGCLLVLLRPSRDQFHRKNCSALESRVLKQDTKHPAGGESIKVQEFSTAEECVHNLCF